MFLRYRAYPDDHLIYAVALGPKLNVIYYRVKKLLKVLSRSNEPLDGGLQKLSIRVQTY